ncbi:MAG TPA: efflux RND transporter periplasmic adaptor subunit [Burkholderiales bacterium]
MKIPYAAAVAAALFLAACAPQKPPAEALRMVRTAELRYGTAGQVNRYVGTVQARHEVDQAFRVGGKVVSRKVDVGQVVREGDVLAILDDTDYRLAEEAARQQLLAAETQARQAESDRKRLEELKADGSVSVSDEEHAQSEARKSKAAAEAAARQLELAANRLKYTVLRASRAGVVTQVRFEIGQVTAEGQPGVAIAEQGEPEIVVDVPEDHLGSFKQGKYKATLAAAPEEAFDVVLRELAPQAAQQTRTFRARLKPTSPRRLALGATATVLVERPGAEAKAAAIPASAITQGNGQPAVWVVHRTGSEPLATVELAHITVHGYRNDEVLISGLPAGELVVTAGVHKMAPGLRVALPELAAQATLPKQASR